jgi:hypothetical protein
MTVLQRLNKGMKERFLQQLLMEIRQFKGEKKGFPVMEVGIETGKINKKENKGFPRRRC